MSDVIPFPIDPGKRQHDEMVASLGAINRMRSEGPAPGASYLPPAMREELRAQYEATRRPDNPFATRPLIPELTAAAGLADRVRALVYDGGRMADLCAYLADCERALRAGAELPMPHLPQGAA